MPMLLGKREYRNFAGQFSVAPDGDEKNPYTVEGYATTFDAPYEFGPDSFEQVRSTALDGADMRDVIFQLNHEGQTLARLKNGTLSLERDAHGLKVRAQLGGSQAGRDLYEAISSGLIDKMSWGFTVDPDGWEWDARTRTATITKVTKVFDVSAVSIPADQDTEIFARSYLDGVIEREHEEFVQRDSERRKRAALKLRLL